MTNPAPSTLVAAVQAAPVFLDREATIEKVGTLTKEAAGTGARLVAFPEGFVPTYPDWVWRTTPWADGPWYARWVDPCADVPGPGCDALGDLAAGHAVRPRGDVRATRRHPPGADVGQLRRVGGIHASHRQGRTVLCARDRVVHAWIRRSGRAPRPRRHLRR